MPRARGFTSYTIWFQSSKICLSFCFQTYRHFSSRGCLENTFGVDIGDDDRQAVAADGLIVVNLHGLPFHCAVHFQKSYL